MPQSLSAVYVHAVFSTLDRNPYLADMELRGKMHGYMVGTSKGLGCPTIIVGGVADHVHLLAILGRTTNQSDWMRDLKRASSRWIKTQVPEFSWQAGYGIFSVGSGEVDAIRTYIERQLEHHRTMTFQEEYRAMLTEYGIEWDERYVWD